MPSLCSKMSRNISSQGRPKKAPKRSSLSIATISASFAGPRQRAEVFGILRVSVRCFESQKFNRARGFP